MASEWAYWRRKADEADAHRAMRPFYVTPAGYLNRHERRRAGRAKRQALKQKRDEVQLPPLAADAGHIESEAPT